MTDPRRPGALTCDEVRESAGAFVLGALDPDETAAVRDHLASCADAHAEIAEVGAMLSVLDASVPQVEPPGALKGRILAAAAADLAGRRGAPGGPAAVATTHPIERPPDVIRIPRRTDAATWALRIAAVLAIALLGGWNLVLQGQLGQARSHDDDVATVLAVAGRPGSLSFVMASAAGTGSGVGAIDAGGTMTVAMRDLPPISGPAVYEAWMIAPGAAPVPLGSLSVSSTGSALMVGSGVPAQAGLVVALTREPGPGATTPTLPLIASGTATSSG